MKTKHDTDAVLTVEDLDPAVDTRAADQVNGGADGSKTTVAPSEVLFHELVHATKPTERV